MAGKGQGISGLAVFMATAGGFLLYVGVRNVPLLEGLREILKGKTPTARPPVITPTPSTLTPSQVFNIADQAGAGLFAPGGSDSVGAIGSVVGVGGGSAIATAAARYLGTPYVLGGHRPGGFDCSGLVTWILANDLGFGNLPNSVHTVTTEWLVWPGAKTIPRADIAAGDLVCWFGHMGIAVSATEMIHAPTPGEVVKRSPIWWIPTPQIRRVDMSKARR